MKKSIRRIANTLLALSVLSLSLSFVSAITIQCNTENVGCMASALTFTNDPVFATDYTISASTVPYAEGGVGAGIEWGSVIQLVSMYALLVAVGILVMLECLELYYLRNFLKLKNFRLR